MRYIGLWVIAAAVVAVLLIVSDSALPPGIRDGVSNVLLAIGLLLGGLGVVAGLAESRAAMREVNACYTTLNNRYAAYWQLDPKTGDVLRRPGEHNAARSR